MATGKVQRGVLIEIETALANGFKQPFINAQKEVENLQRMAGNIKVGFSTDMGSGIGAQLAALRKQADDVAQLSARANGRTSAGIGGSKKLDDFIERTTRKQLEKEEREQAAINKQRDKAAEAERKAKEKATADAEKSAAKKAAAEQKELDKLQRDRQKQLDASLKADEKFWADAVKQAKQGAVARAKAIAEADKYKAGGWDRLSDMGANATKHSGGGAKWQAGLANLAKQHQREQAEAAAKATEAIARQKEAFNRLSESIVSSTEAVSNLGRGLAYLGLAGEDDLRGLTDSLLKIQGTVDTLKGSVQSLRDIGGLIRNFKDVRSVGGIGGVGRALLGMGPVAGTGAAATGTTAGTAAAGAAGVAGTIGAAAAALAGLAAAAVSAKQTFGDARRFGFMAGAEHGSWRDRWGGRVAGVGSGIVGAQLSVMNRLGISEATQDKLMSLDPTGHAMAFGESARASAKTDRMMSAAERDRKARQEHDERQAGVLRERYGKSQEAYNRESEEREFRLRLAATGSPLEDLQAKAAALREQQAGANFLRGDYMSARHKIIGPNGEGTGSIRDRENRDQLKEVEKELLELKKQEQLLTRDIQKEAISGLEKQLSLQKQQLDAKRSQYATISKMGPMELTALKSIQERLKTNAAGLHERELQLAEQAGGRAGQLARKERERRGRALQEQYGIESASPDEDADLDTSNPAAQEYLREKQRIKDLRRQAGFSQPEERYDQQRQAELADQASGKQREQQARGDEQLARPPANAPRPNDVGASSPMPTPQQTAAVPQQIQNWQKDFLQATAKIKLENKVVIEAGDSIGQVVQSSWNSFIANQNDRFEALIKELDRKASINIANAIHRQNIQSRQFG